MKKPVLYSLLLTMAIALCGCGQTKDSTATEAAEAATEAATEAAIEAESEVIEIPTEISAEPVTETTTESGKESSAEESGAATAGTTESDITTAGWDGSTLSPLPTDIAIYNLTNATVSVSFSASEINWMGSCVDAEIYAPLTYCKAGVSALQAGNIVKFDGSDITVQTVSGDDAEKIINEGLENEIDFWQTEDGTYQIVLSDDAPEMEDLGTVSLTLSQDVVLKDQTDPAEDAKEITSDEIKNYMDSLDEITGSFSAECTTMTITDGEVTEIERFWMP